MQSLWSHKDYDAHETVIETADARRARGMPVDQDVTEKRLRKVRSRKGVLGCGRCVSCKCGMSCKKGTNNPWHDPDSATLAVAKRLSDPYKVVQKHERLRKVGVSACDCAVQGRVCRCRGC